jgi:predicted phosphate transport protein (TIGR00153 family)
MSFSLIPKEQKFFEMFSRAAKNAVEAARTYKELVQDYTIEHPNFQKIRDLEHEGDIITHEVMDSLNRTFITPFDREDIHGLTSDLDNIVDAIQAVSDRMQMYHIDRKDPFILKLAEILEKAVREVEKAVREMADFKNARRVLDFCIEINRLENEGDSALTEAIRNLFRNGTKDPLEVIKWKEVYEITESAIDRCEDVANTIEGIVVKNA